MGLENFKKQPYEEFLIAGDYVNVLNSGETLVLGSSSAAASDSAGNDQTSVVLDVSTLAVSGSQLKVKVRAGVTGETYKITFKTTTSLGYKWEIDVNMRVIEE